MTGVRGARRQLLVYLAGLMAAIAFLQFARARYVFDFNDAAFGQLTTGIYGERSGGVHCDGLESKLCETTYEAAGRPPAVLWLGNSQLPGVNRYRPGERTAVMDLHERVRARGRYLVGYSLPGATLFEHAIILNKVAPKFTFDTLVLAVVFNNLRESPVRDGMAKVLREPDVLARVGRSLEAPSLLPLAAGETAQEPAPGASETLAARVERNLDTAIGRVWPLWAERPKLRALASYAFHVMRQKPFGINAQTKRPVLNSGYATRMAVLDQMLKDARASGMLALVYIAPYRQDIRGPYIETEYAQFKKDVERIARDNAARYLDIDGIVPGAEWGMVRDYLTGTDDFDFMHFTAGGHRRLSDAIDRELRAAGR